MKPIKTIKTGITLSLLITLSTFSQNRIHDNSSILWTGINASIGCSKNVTFVASFDARRVEFGKDWQQTFTAIGGKYKWNENITCGVNYAYLKTFAYGTYPLNALGKDFDEHRGQEWVAISNKVGRVDFSSRFMLENRWVATFNSLTSVKPDSWTPLHRLRYQYKITLPLIGHTLEAKEPYFTGYEEIFIGFGKNVNKNVFDQNRLAIGLGYKFSKNLNLEASFFNQIVELGREKEGKNIFQSNTGMMIALNYNLPYHHK